MKSTASSSPRGFTLLETVIAIGVLAVLLTGFMVVFTPAAEGIRKSINIQQADRMTSALEHELVALHGPPEVTKYGTGFNKAFDWIQKSNVAAPKDALLVYQYRGKVSSLRSDDNTPTPEPVVKDKLPGQDYVVVPMARRKSDPKLAEDLAAVEGAVYLVKCNQLIFNKGQLISGTAGEIKDPTGGAAATSADVYPEAVIAFSAEFHMLPAKTAAYISGAAFSQKFNSVKNPVFTRNLAVRR